MIRQATRLGAAAGESERRADDLHWDGRGDERSKGTRQPIITLLTMDSDSGGAGERLGQSAPGGSHIANY